MPKGKRRPDANIDLGLAISALTLKYGQTRSHKEIAAYCGCSWQAIYSIEAKALHKVRKALYMRKDPVLIELLQNYRGRSKSLYNPTPSV